MRKIALLCASVLLLLTVLAPAQQNSKARAEFEKLGQHFSKAIASKDAAAVAQMYSSDAQAFPPNAETASGRDAIQKLWQGYIDAGATNLTLTIAEVDGSGNLMYETGTFDFKAADGKQIDKGKYLTVWKREGGQWKLHRDIWNSSLPAPGTAQ